jgi:hypothetical protein
MTRDAKLVTVIAALSLAGVIVLSVKTASLGPGTVGGPVARVAPRERADGPFESDAVRHVKAAPPARFAAPLPRVAEFRDFDAERFPPQAHVRDLLCAGDEDMWRRLRESISASSGAGVADVARTWGELLEFCEGDGCAAARHVGAARSPAAAYPAWRVAARCPSAEAAALFRRRDAPADAVLARADASRESRRIAPPDPERVVDAALQVIAATDGIDRRLAAFQLAAAGRKGGEALLALHARERDAERRHDLAMALADVDDPRARAAWKAACARRTDGACSRPDVRPANAAPEPPEPPGAPPPAALVARLRALRLLPEAELPAADVAGIDSADMLLAAAGRAYAFDVETSMFPNEHDALLRSLAALEPGRLGGAMFDEVPPPEDDEDEKPYLLRAWAYGERWEVAAENLGDWYDVGACVRLLNAIARERKLDVRWIVLETGDQTAIVAAGPEAGLRTAVAEKLLRVAAAGDAAEAGKGFEQKVLEQLRREER